MPRLTKKQRAENEERAQSGRNIIDAYIANECGYIDVDRSSVLVYLLADLMHRSHLDCEADDFEQALDAARAHFNAEIRGGEERIDADSERNL